MKKEAEQTDKILFIQLLQSHIEAKNRIVDKNPSRISQNVIKIYFHPFFPITFLLSLLYHRSRLVNTHHYLWQCNRVFRASFVSSEQIMLQVRHTAPRRWLMRCIQCDLISPERRTEMMAIEVSIHNCHRYTQSTPPHGPGNRPASVHCNFSSAFYDNHCRTMSTHSNASHCAQQLAPDRKFSFRQCSRRRNCNCRCLPLSPSELSACPPE